MHGLNLPPRFMRVMQGKTIKGKPLMYDHTIDAVSNAVRSLGDLSHEMEITHRQKEKLKRALRILKKALD